MYIKVHYSYIPMYIKYMQSRFLFIGKSIGNPNNRTYALIVRFDA